MSLFATRTQKAVARMLQTEERYCVQAMLLPPDHKVPLFVNVPFYEGQTTGLAEDLDVEPYLRSSAMESVTRTIQVQMEGMQALMMYSPKNWPRINPAIKAMVGNQASYARGPILVVLVQDAGRVIDVSASETEDLCCGVAGTFLHQIAEWEAELAYEKLGVVPAEEGLESEEEVDPDSSEADDDLDGDESIDSHPPSSPIKGRRRF